MATITNPDDLNAVEAALQLKDETGCEVVVVTMGPPPAEGMPVSYTHLDVYKRQGLMTRVLMDIGNVSF